MNLDAQITGLTEAISFWPPKSTSLQILNIRTPAQFPNRPPARPFLIIGGLDFVDFYTTPGLLFCMGLSVQRSTYLKTHWFVRLILVKKIPLPAFSVRTKAT